MKRLIHKIGTCSFHEIKGARALVKKFEAETEFGVRFVTWALRLAAMHKLNCVDISFEDWQFIASDYIHERENIVH